MSSLLSSLLSTLLWSRMGLLLTCYPRTCLHYACCANHATPLHHTQALVMHDTYDASRVGSNGSACHIHNTSKGLSAQMTGKRSSNEHTNNWGLIWEAGVRAAAAAAAKSPSRGKLQQWQDIRRKARGNSITPPNQLVALEVQYSSLENEFEVGEARY